MAPSLPLCSSGYSPPDLPPASFQRKCLWGTLLCPETAQLDITTCHCPSTTLSLFWDCGFLLLSLVEENDISHGYPVFEPTVFKVALHCLSCTPEPLSGSAGSSRGQRLSHLVVGNLLCQSGSGQPASRLGGLAGGRGRPGCWPAVGLRLGRVGWFHHLANPGQRRTFLLCDPQCPLAQN